MNKKKQNITYIKSSKTDKKVAVKNLDYLRCYRAPLNDLTDVAETNVIAETCNNKIIYSCSSGFLRYDDVVWSENKMYAVQYIKDFTQERLNDVDTEIKELQGTLEELKLIDDIGNITVKNNNCNSDEKNIIQQYKNARIYREHIIRCRSQNKINALIEGLKSQISFDIENLDKSPYLLNTPQYTYDLRYGIEEGRKDHDPNDLITKVTKVEPSAEGYEVWQKCLKLFFQDNSELINYIQKIIGMIVFGKVYSETLFIAYGSGCNGKSTFFNSIAKVLGSYSGLLSADLLTKQSVRNAKYEIAELKGKRLVISSELEEGKDLNTAIIKQLCY